MRPTTLPISVPDELGATKSRGASILTVIFCAALFLIGFAFSAWILEIYVAGDQQYYNEFWTAMTWSRPSQWSGIQTRYLGSNDILYSVIIAVGTGSGWDRIFYISAWNGLLVSSIGYILVKYRAFSVFCVLLLTNYYLLVLISSAERVKFAYLFLTLALCSDKTQIRLMCSIMAAFCHTQSIVQFISSGIYLASSEYKRIIANKKRMAIILFAAPIVLLAAGYYLYSNAGEVISRKSDFYAGQSQGFLEVVQWVLILLTGVLVFDKRVQYVLSMMPLGILTYLYGNRINVATLALFCMLALVQRRTSHPLVLAVMAYMSFKSIGFIDNVLSTGQGF